MKKRIITFILIILCCGVKAQNFILDEDSISIYKNVIARRRHWADSSFSIKNIAKFVPYKYKKNRVGFWYKIYYPNIGISFETSNRIEHPFVNTYLFKIEADFYVKKCDSSTIIFCGHPITHDMNFTNFCADKFWNTFLEKDLLDECKYNKIIYVSGEYSKYSFLFEFENFPPYQIHSVAIHF